LDRDAPSRLRFVPFLFYLLARSTVVALCPCLQSSSRTARHAAIAARCALELRKSADDRLSHGGSSRWDSDWTTTSELASTASTMRPDSLVSRGGTSGAG